MSSSRASSFLRFDALTPRRIRRVLLVGSRYDAFLLEEDGRLQELLARDLHESNAEDSQWLTHVSTAREAIAAFGKEPFDLIVLTPHLRDGDALDLAAKLRAADANVPIAPLVFDDVELEALRARSAEAARAGLERPYLWEGDFRLLPAIVQSLEDRASVAHDTKKVGVSVVLLIEDSVHAYSSFLPMLYGELNKQSRRVISEGLNLENKRSRLRARPKIVHCTTFEEAEEQFRRYADFLLGIVSDVSFPIGGRSEPDAGLRFARLVRASNPDLPILLQSRDPDLAQGARAVSAFLVQKGSPLLLQNLSRFMTDNFGFGDFVFRAPDGRECGRAKDVRELEQRLREVPETSVRFHAERNHFSTWLRARTEFELARRLRPRKISEFSTTEDLRGYLIDALHAFRRERQCGVVSDFDAKEFHPETSFARIGGGSLGGKARGLAFVRRLIETESLRRRFPDVELAVPSAAVLATDVFDRFVEAGDLRDFALEVNDDAAIEKRFLEARFPEDVFERLLEFLDLARTPLAVRSSSLLEDSQSLPFTGVYRTYMVPNSHPDRSVRLKELLNAIKRVYASTFFQQAKRTVRDSPYRLEEEKMAVVLERVVGRRRGNRFYPHVSGVARSWNYYAVPPLRQEDGVASVALGLGEMVVGGGKSFLFSPAQPERPLSSGAASALFESSQSTFFALELEEEGSRPDPSAELKLVELPLSVALGDGVLAPLASTYSHEDDRIHDGLGRDGAPLVTFAPILKHGAFPLAEILSVLLDVGRRAMNRPVELEFAVDLDARPAEFAFLQMRPFVQTPGDDDVSVPDPPAGAAVCFSAQVLGHGARSDVFDVVFVDRDRFDRARSREAARAVAALDAELKEARRPYLLIGVGRFGASDPWLGLPVAWDEISGAAAIVECDFRDLAVTPSQGSHFFHNLTATGTRYFTVGADRTRGFVDWSWLLALDGARGASSAPEVRHVRLASPLSVEVDGRRARGVVW